MANKFTMEYIEKASFMQWAAKERLLDGLNSSRIAAICDRWVAHKAGQVPAESVAAGYNVKVGVLNKWILDHDEAVAAYDLAVRLDGAAKCSLTSCANLKVLQSS